MVRHLSVIAGVLWLAACGGGDNKPANKTSTAKVVAPKKETEEDREARRRKAAGAIVPEGSTCLPAALKAEDGPRLDVGQIDKDLVVCATDTQESRLLGPIACWKVNLAATPIGLVPTEAAPLPGRGIGVGLDGKCARAYCLPEAVDSKTAFMSWSLDGSKVAVLAGGKVHLFDAATKAHQSSFPVTGDNGVTNEPVAVHFVGDRIFVEGTDAGPFSAVWAFKLDGAPLGQIQGLGSNAAASTFNGSFSILDKNRVAIAEQGYTTVTIYEVETGKRTKLVRKLTKPPCKPADLDAYWLDQGEVPGKCAAHMKKTFGHLIGAPAVAGSKSFVVALRGDRLGELGLLDLKTLAEKSTLKLPWCADGGDTSGGDAGASAAEDSKTEKSAAPASAAPPAPSATPKGKKGAAPAAKAEDPDAGGE